MKFQPEKLSSDWVVHGYDENGVLINGIRHQSSLIFGSQLAPQAWEHASSDEMVLTPFEWLYKQCPKGTEVLLVGTGDKQVFPPIEIRRFFAQKNCPVEYMDTQAACRTYNILVGEGRQVVAAIII
ncbi:MAG: Mth938-like domain-containing protein [Limnobacter sp.]|nr:Mth938-like domain-containing protein [Limnobacter sp.]